MPQTGIGKPPKPPKPKPAPKPTAVRGDQLGDANNKAVAAQKGKLKDVAAKVNAETSPVGPKTLADIPKADKIGGKNNPSKYNKKGNVVPKASSSDAYKAGFSSDKDYTKGGTIKQAAAKRFGLDFKGVSVKPGPIKGGGGGGGGTFTGDRKTGGGGGGGGSRTDGGPGSDPRPGGGFKDGGGIVATPPSGSFRGSFVGTGEVAGGGQSGGATNPLQAGSLKNLRGKDVEDVVSGETKTPKAKKRSKRGTE